jgi:hypothetical protein
MAEAKTYEGGCHCGAVRYTVTTDMAQVMECNCSHCSKKGFVLTFVAAQQFELTSGEEALTEYLFNTGRIRHRFCKVCGVESFAEGAMPDGQPTRAVNLRCVDGVDLKALNPMQWDGANA